MIQKYSSYPLHPVPSIRLPMCPPTQISQTMRHSSSWTTQTKVWIWWTTKRSSSLATARTSYTCTCAPGVLTTNPDRATWSYAWPRSSKRSLTSPLRAEGASTARAYKPLSTCGGSRDWTSTSPPRTEPSRLRMSSSASATCWGSASTERERLGRSTLQRPVQSSDPTWTTGLELKEYTLLLVLKTRPTVQNRIDSAIAWMYLLAVECVCISL